MDCAVYEAAYLRSYTSLDNLSEAESKIKIQSLTCGQGNTSLHVATKSGNHSFAEKLLRSRPSLLRERNAKGDTALHIAVRLGHLDLAALLIRSQAPQAGEGNALLAMENGEKNTALHEAVMGGHGQMVELLIGENPSLACLANGIGESPLFMAVDRKHYEIARRILEAYPSCSSASGSGDGFWSGRNGMTAMHAAVIRLHYIPLYYGRLRLRPSQPLWVKCGIIFLMVYRTCANIVVTGFRHVFLPSIMEQDFVKEMLDTSGGDILEVQDDNGWMPLHYAARIGNCEVTKLFLETNSSLAYIKDKDGMSAFHIAAGNGRNPIMNVLISKCPDVCELFDNRDRTALHVAVETGYLNVVNNLQHLVVFNDLLNEKDVEGNTALHLAAIHGRYKILRSLSNDRRVDKMCTNKAGMTVVDIIRSSPNLGKDKKVSLISMLKGKGAEPSLERRPFALERMMEQINEIKSYEMSYGTEYLEVEEPKNEKKTSLSYHAAERGEKKPNHGVRKRYYRWSPELVKNMANINLLVATIIMSITFSASIAMPGGYNDADGIAILRAKTSFRYFLFFDSLAFGCSAASMSIHFLVAVASRFVHETYSYPITGVLCLTLLSIASTVWAFIAGTNVVLSHRSGFGLSAATAFISFIVPVSFFLVRLVVVLYNRFHLLVESEK